MITFTGKKEYRSTGQVAEDETEHSVLPSEIKRIDWRINDAHKARVFISIGGGLAHTFIVDKVTAQDIVDQVAFQRESKIPHMRKTASPLSNQLRQRSNRFGEVNAVADDIDEINAKLAENDIGMSQQIVDLIQRLGDAHEEIARLENWEQSANDWMNECQRVKKERDAARAKAESYYKQYKEFQRGNSDD